MKSFATFIAEMDQIQEDNGVAYGVVTTKTANGFDWIVRKTEYNKPQTTMKSGSEPTRAKAMAKAKKALMPYRRGEVTE